jgi:hopanoid biosynthesis associated protein HpnK
LRRLIINADDFGLTSGVNRAIAEANRNGVLGSATLMATGSAFAEAADLIPQLPGMSVGCHVVLVDGAPILPARQIPSLTKSEGRFESKLSSFVRQALLGRLRADEIEAEATAQIRKLQAAGIRLSHFDTHKHTHMFPQIARPLLRAARACGVQAVRNPFEGPKLSLLSWNRQLWIRQFQTALLSILAAGFRRSVAEHGVATTDGTIGIAATGSMTMRSLQPLIESLPEGTWEWVCHPGYNDADLKNAGTRLMDSRELELEILTAPDLRETLERAGIELITFRDLAVQ